MIFSNLTKTPHLWIYIILSGIVVSSTIYFIRENESPEDCFVRKINEWAVKKEMSLGRLTDTNDTKLAVSIARTYVAETAKGKEDGGLRMNIKTYMDYCDL